MSSLSLWLLLGCSREAPPTVSLSANPASVDAGQCTTLTWSSTNAAAVAIDQRVGKVDASGSKQVCPGGSTQYTITAQREDQGQSPTTVSVTALAAESHDVSGSSACSSSARRS